MAECWVSVHLGEMGHDANERRRNFIWMVCVVGVEKRSAGNSFGKN